MTLDHPSLKNPAPKTNYEPDGSCNECDHPTWLDIGDTETQCGLCSLKAKYGTQVNTLADAIPAVRRAIKGGYDTKIYCGSDGVFRVSTSISERLYAEFGRVIPLPTSEMTNDDTDDVLKKFITGLFEKAAMPKEKTRPEEAAA